MTSPTTVSEVTPPLQQWLASCGLEVHYEALTLAGYQDLRTLAAARADASKIAANCSMPRGHARHFVRSVEQLSSAAQSASETPTAEAAGATQTGVEAAGDEKPAGVTVPPPFTVFDTEPGLPPKPADAEASQEAAAGALPSPPEDALQQGGETAASVVVLGEFTLDESLEKVSQQPAEPASEVAAWGATSPVSQKPEAVEDASLAPEATSAEGQATQEEEAAEAVLAPAEGNAAAPEAGAAPTHSFRSEASPGLASSETSYLEERIAAPSEIETVAESDPAGPFILAPPRKAEEGAVPNGTSSTSASGDAWDPAAGPRKAPLAPLPLGISTTDSIVDGNTPSCPGSPTLGKPVGSVGCMATIGDLPTAGDNSPTNKGSRSPAKKKSNVMSDWWASWLPIRKSNRPSESTHSVISSAAYSDAAADTPPSSPKGAPKERQPIQPLPCSPELILYARKLSEKINRVKMDVGKHVSDQNKTSIVEQMTQHDKVEFLKLAHKDPACRRAMGALVGMACGDSVGCPLEFVPVGTKGSRFDPKSLKYYGEENKFKLQPGQWTDDTSMGLCMADSLLCSCTYDPSDIRVRFWNWWYRNYNNAFRLDKTRSKSIGLGQNISMSLNVIVDGKPPPRYETNCDDAGNGSLMRLAPVPVFFAREPELAVRASAESSYTTHPGRLAADCCAFLGHLIVMGMARSGKRESAQQFLDRVIEDYLLKLEQENYLQPELVTLLLSHQAPDSLERMWDWKDPKGPFLQETLANRGFQYNGRQVNDSYLGSYCMDGLAVALHCFYHTTSYMAAITKCVNCLGDADTTAAICGQMAGVFYGVDGIDARLIKLLAKWDQGDIALRAALCYALGHGMSEVSRELAVKRCRDAFDHQVKLKQQAKEQQEQAALAESQERQRAAEEAQRAQRAQADAEWAAAEALRLQQEEEQRVLSAPQLGEACHEDAMHHPEAPETSVDGVTFDEDDMHEAPGQADAAEDEVFVPEGEAPTVDDAAAAEADSPEAALPLSPEGAAAILLDELPPMPDESCEPLVPAALGDVSLLKRKAAS
eukprot:TRINITY_DN45163_c0_g1_i1.p1 TRINITY_DN45163_c0_g1~~TRINITY_DN45163_c0_g1_i1.p1  ORF type:complete len:1069 (+),score=271.69 TRINITY_DN45163_c0_g1_i1:61-3207(+)